MSASEGEGGMSTVRANWHLWTPWPLRARLEPLPLLVNTITWVGFVSDCMEWDWPDRRVA
jgi:hypothetical protein